MQTYCRNYQGIVQNEYQPNKHKFARVRCKMWQCPYCWKVNQAQWRAVLFKQLPALSREWSFHTFTCKSKDHSDHKTAEIIRTHWDTLMKRLKRAYGNFSYVRVLEQHESGEWHIHMIASFHIPLDDLRTVRNKDKSIKYQYSARIKREILNGIPFGKICSVSNLAPDAGEDTGAVEKAIGYVTKYMTKRDDTFEISAKEKKIRIIQTSRDIKFKPEKTDEVWTLKSGVYLDEVMRGEVWIDLNKGGEVITPEHFTETFIYPDDAQRPNRE